MIQGSTSKRNNQHCMDADSVIYLFFIEHWCLERELFPIYQIRICCMNAGDDNTAGPDDADDNTVVDTQCSMLSNSDMSGQVLNSKTMELESDIVRGNRQCDVQKSLALVTPYLLCFLSVLVCLLAGGVYHYHMEVGHLETQVEDLSKSVYSIKNYRGEKGGRGESGQPGLPGETGQKGRQGAAGLTGLKGNPGDEGQQGQKGVAGVVGPVGPEGLKGQQGDKGDKGRIGEVGEIGPKGDQGMHGLRGEKGERGPVGPQGPEGPMGESALNLTDIEVQGPPGEKGERGQPGEKGEKGDKGESVMLADPFGKTC